MEDAKRQTGGGRLEAGGAAYEPILPMDIGSRWTPIQDADPRGFALFSRHYTYRDYADGRRRLLRYRNARQFVGPGEKMVLLATDGRALFAWRKFIDDSGQQGVNCAVFRNEGGQRSSRLIFEADDLAWSRWPGERFYTYVDPNEIRSTNPGCCFKKAGWRKCGETAGGLIILEMFPCWRKEVRP
jgi:hypothetical protein